MRNLIDDIGIEIKPNPYTNDLLSCLTATG